MPTIRATLVTLAALMAGCSTNSAIGSDASETTGGRGETVFADEFNGTVLDRAKWTVYTGPIYNSELQAYVDDTSNVFIARGAEAAGASDGVLVLRARHHPGGVAGGASRIFTSGRLHGRVQFQFGTA